MDIAWKIFQAISTDIQESSEMNERSCHPDENLTITDIAAACGFNGASYYTEVFRKIMGTSPSAYRKST